MTTAFDSKWQAPEHRLQDFLLVASDQKLWTQEELVERSNNPLWLLEEAEAHALLASIHGEPESQFADLHRSVAVIAEIAEHSLQRAALSCVRALLPDSIRPMLLETAFKFLSFQVAMPSRVPVCIEERMFLYRKAYLPVKHRIAVAGEADTAKASLDETIISQPYVDDFMGHMFEFPGPENEIAIRSVAVDAMLHGILLSLREQTKDAKFTEHSKTDEALDDDGFDMAFVNRELSKLAERGKQVADVFKLRFLGLSSLPEIAQMMALSEEEVADLFDVAEACIDPVLLTR